MKFHFLSTQIQNLYLKKIHTFDNNRIKLFTSKINKHAALKNKQTHIAHLTTTKVNIISAEVATL